MDIFYFWVNYPFKWPFIIHVYILKVVFYFLFEVH